jgi:hypothetical protein
MKQEKRNVKGQHNLSYENLKLIQTKTPLKSEPT